MNEELGVRLCLVCLEEVDVVEVRDRDEARALATDLAQAQEDIVYAPAVDINNPIRSVNAVLIYPVHNVEQKW